MRIRFDFDDFGEHFGLFEMRNPEIRKFCTDKKEKYLDPTMTTSIFGPPISNRIV